jgi:MFS family permease
MSKIASFFGFTDADDRVLKLAGKFAIFLPLVSFTVMISTTFYVIFVAEALGGGDYIAGMGLVGILVVVQMAIQILFDYPSGAIGDWIGQRFVISSAFFLHALTFFMISLVTTSSPFWFLVLIYALQGVANSQESGAWGAWFDNNYRAAMPSDTDRKQYGVFQGRVGMLFQIVATASLIPGSILAMIFTRAWVFQIQAILCTLLAIAVLRIIQDFPEVEAARVKPTMSEYTTLLKDGVKFLFSDNFIMYLTVGTMLAMSCIMVWGNLILFPMYYSYLRTDVAVAAFRTLLFVPGIFSLERSGIWSRKFEPKKWIPRFRILQTCGFIFFSVFALIMFVFPPAPAGSPTYEVYFPFTDVAIFMVPIDSIIPVIVIFSTFVSTGFFHEFANILTQRQLLDVIPNRIRNSMYSLQPTIATLLAIPQILVFGWIISDFSFSIALAGVGLVSLLGVILIRHGLSHPKPVVEGETWGTKQTQDEEIEEEQEELDRVEQLAVSSLDE